MLFRDMPPKITGIIIYAPRSQVTDYCQKAQFRTFRRLFVPSIFGTIKPQTPSYFNMTEPRARAARHKGQLNFEPESEFTATTSPLHDANIHSSPRHALRLWGR